MAFWQSRHEALGVAYEQLDTSNARAVVALLKSRSSDRNLLASFQNQHSELVRVRPHACMHAYMRANACMPVLSSSSTALRVP